MNEIFQDIPSYIKSYAQIMYEMISSEKNFPDVIDKLNYYISIAPEDYKNYIKTYFEYRLFHGE